ncbi:MAG: ABC transporter permease [Jiangellaceae bacterium]
MTDPTTLYPPAAPPATAPAPSAPGAPAAEPRSLAGDAWHDLRRNPIFLASAVVIAVLLVMAAFPGLFTDRGPRDCDLTFSRLGPSMDAWFGYDVQGCDVYTRTIYGARASILVGIVTTAVVSVVGGVVGMLAGFYGGWVDSLLSRITDVFFAIPLLLGGMLVLVSFPSGPRTPEWQTIGKVAIALALLGWPPLARIMRSAVISVKQADYVQAAQVFGADARRLLRRHVLPNAATPVIVYATIVLGVFISVEATLSFLGIGLQPPVVSWGVAISDAASFARQSPHMLLFPSAFLSVTVLAFIVLGDAVRDAFDPRLR